MATRLLKASFFFPCVFLLFVILLGSFPSVSSDIPVVNVTCKTTVDLQANHYDAGLIVSQLPDRIPIFADETERCDIYLRIPTGYELMFYFDELDFYSGSGSHTSCDMASITLFDGTPSQVVRGLDRQICGKGDQMPTGVYFVYNNIFIIRVTAQGAFQGTGFRVHFNVYRRAIPCSTEEFSCETFGSFRCISQRLVCDTWNDCGDWADEMGGCSHATGEPDLIG